MPNNPRVRVQHMTAAEVAAWRARRTSESRLTDEMLNAFVGARVRPRIDHPPTVVGPHGRRIALRGVRVSKTTGSAYSVKLTHRPATMRAFYDVCRTLIAELNRRGVKKRAAARLIVACVLRTFPPARFPELYHDLDDRVFLNRLWAAMYPSRAR